MEIVYSKTIKKDVYIKAIEATFEETSLYLVETNKDNLPLAIKETKIVYNYTNGKSIVYNYEIGRESLSSSEKLNINDIVDKYYKNEFELVY